MSDINTKYYETSNIDNMTCKAIDQMHAQQRIEPNAENYFATILINGSHHADITITRAELENNGVELHPLVKQMLINEGVSEG